MLDQVAVVFEDKKKMLRRLKKASYERNMNEFREKYEHFLLEMLDYMAQHAEPERAADEVSEIFTEKVREAFTVRGKISGPVQTDLNFCMIFYVFPAILLTERPDAKLLADRLCEKWGKSFKNSQIGYTDYESLYNSFNEKILGLF